MMEICLKIIAKSSRCGRPYQLSWILRRASASEKPRWGGASPCRMRAWHTGLHSRWNRMIRWRRPEYFPTQELKLKVASLDFIKFSTTEMLFIFLTPQSTFLSWGKIQSVSLEIGRLVLFPVTVRSECAGPSLPSLSWLCFSYKESETQKRLFVLSKLQSPIPHPKLILNKLLTYQKLGSLHTLALTIIS